MSLLTPLYIAGFLALSLPLVFHLIRRTPSGEAPFSSLMFLTPSPPRLTKRSRLDNLLLLLLRGLALALLALAFARPFLRQAARLDRGEVQQERVAILLDTSASMRRADLWPRAVAAVNETVSNLRPQDEVAVLAADDSLRPIASFEDLSQVDPARRAAIIEQRLKSEAPSWSGTSLGRALLDAVEIVRDARDSSEEEGRAPRRVVLISDMQSGSRLEEVGGYAWPDDVTLDLQRIEPDTPGNAGLHLLGSDDSLLADGSARDGAELRIRVTNSADSTSEQFLLEWKDESGNAVGDPTNAYVPPGESRVVRVKSPRQDSAATRLELQGDATPFDNTLYTVSRRRQSYSVGYLGEDEASDPQAYRYYLDRALTSDPSLKVTIEPLDSSEVITVATSDDTPLIAVTSAPTEAQAETLRDYVERGGALLYVVTSPADAAALALLSGADIRPSGASDAPQAILEQTPEDYAMLGEIDFSHPLFAPMSGPQFNDFTQIRFWKYWRIGEEVLPDARAVASFEGGDAAVLEQRIGRGRLVVMTAGWRPEESQLARSWKFLLMLTSLVDSQRSGRGFHSEYVINERVDLPREADLGSDAKVIKPDGAESLLTTAADGFTATDLPGAYTLQTAAGPLQFVVNLAPSESDTTPLADERFEQLGARLSGKVDEEQNARLVAQMRDVELESRQKIWQWLVAAALVVLIVETWLAGRLTHRLAAPPAPA